MYIRLWPLFGATMYEFQIGKYWLGILRLSFWSKRNFPWFRYRKFDHE